MVDYVELILGVKPKKKKRKKRVKKKHPSQRKYRMKCSSCRATEEVANNIMRRAARVRCSKCGGPLNRPNQA